jgi:hypothetical protein
VNPEVEKKLADNDLRTEVSWHGRIHFPVSPAVNRDLNGHFLQAKIYLQIVVKMYIVHRQPGWFTVGS